MSLKFKKDTLFQFLLGACVAVPYLVNYELTFLVWIFTLIITFKLKFSISFIKYLLCFISILILAVFATDFSKSEIYYIIRDFTYLIKPVLGLLIGYQICRFIYKNALETIVYTGVGISLIHNFIILITFIQFRNISVSLLRVYCGFFSDFEVYVLILVIFYKQFQINLSKKKQRYILYIVGFSCFMYLSRTNFIQFIVLFLAVKGYFVLNKRAIIAIASVVTFSIIFYSIVLVINPKRNGSSFEEFLYKIKIAPTEPFKSKVNVSDYKDFNVNYRSVEIIYTKEQVVAAGNKAVIFGLGLGSKINLKQEVYLGDMKLKHISVLHNGFMTTFLKSGIIGTIILSFSILLLFKQYYQRKSNSIVINHIDYLLVGSAVFLLVSNWVLMGYYFTLDSKSILIGLFIAYREITIKNQELNIT